MRQIKVLYGENNVNDWLNENKELPIMSISFSADSDGDYFMIVYEVNEATQ